MKIITRKIRNIKSGVCSSNSMIDWYLYLYVSSSSDGKTTGLLPNRSVTSVSTLADTWPMTAVTGHGGMLLTLMYEQAHFYTKYIVRWLLSTDHSKPINQHWRWMEDEECPSSICYLVNRWKTVIYKYSISLYPKSKYAQPYLFKMAFRWLSWSIGSYYCEVAPKCSIGGFWGLYLYYILGSLYLLEHWNWNWNSYFFTVLYWLSGFHERCC